MIAWLTEEEGILYPMVLEEKREIQITRSGSYFYKDLQTANGMFYIFGITFDGIPFEICLIATYQQ